MQDEDCPSPSFIGCDDESRSEEDLSEHRSSGIKYQLPFSHLGSTPKLTKRARFLSDGLLTTFAEKKPATLEDLVRKLELNEKL